MTILTHQQTRLFQKEYSFPSTRFQGSKLKIVDWIWDAIKEFNFETALDAFGGTGCVAYKIKGEGKKITYNDMLKFNWYIGLALIENDKHKLSEDEIDFILTRHKEVKYPTFVYDTFKGIYFPDDENRWIDTAVVNINLLENNFKKALAYFALFQTCITKRPFNLFHRKNLYLRFSEVERTFGNKTTWDTPSEIHFKKFINEANYAVFSNGKKNRAFNFDVFEIEGTFDLVYVDPPYISKKGAGVDYIGFYHFLEGMVNYYKWKEMIDYKTKHKRLKAIDSEWVDKKRIYLSFDNLFKKFKDSIIVVSYRSDGIPSINELKNLLKKYKPKVEEFRRKDYKYALSLNHCEEVLLLGS